MLFLIVVIRSINVPCVNDICKFPESDVCGHKVGNQNVGVQYPGIITIRKRIQHMVSQVQIISDMSVDFCVGMISWGLFA